MLWYWLKHALRWLAIWLGPTPSWAARVAIDKNAKCPACGHCDGQLSFARLRRPKTKPTPALTGDGKVIAVGQPFVKHACNVCGCMWLEAPMSTPAMPLN